MKANKKAVKLVKITFEKIANATNYKCVKNDGGKIFGIIEDLSKKIAKDFIKETISELEEFDNSDGYAQGRIDYWRNVESELDSL
jgi:hypothetical protein